MPYATPIVECVTVVRNLSSYAALRGSELCKLSIQSRVMLAGPNGREVGESGRKWGTGRSRARKGEGSPGC
eukprot:427981-Pyramimonas_sp.AAC.1